MLRIYAAYPDTGLLGAKLLYEDGTVQHAGMESRRSKYWHDLWINAYPYKGLSPAGLSGILEAECVTAACALVETGLYRAVGGLSEHYIVGDFEDSDLCHNLRGHGRRNRVALDVVLYHLERQSQSLAGDPEWRTALSIYNCWVHNRRWGGAISGVAA
jgi:GT2 family glycosyltransferase